MLVLSRRPNEAIVLPIVNTRIQVVAVKGGVVRLGVEAPAAMSVYREEVWKEMQARAARGEAHPADAPGGVPPSAPTAALAGELNQLVRNRLHSATLGMAQLRQELQSGQGEQAGATLGKIENEFDLLRRQLDEVRERFAAASSGRAGRAEEPAPAAEKPLSQPPPRFRPHGRPRQPRSAERALPAPGAPAHTTTE